MMGGETVEERLAGWMQAAQEGDAVAYQRLLRECVPVIARTVRALGLPPDRVEDVVQETSLTIHRARRDLRSARPFLPWLRAIARRRAIDARPPDRTPGRPRGSRSRGLRGLRRAAATRHPRRSSGRTARAGRRGRGVAAGGPAAGGGASRPRRPLARRGRRPDRTQQGRAQGQPASRPEGAAPPVRRGARRGCLTPRATTGLSASSRARCGRRRLPRPGSGRPDGSRWSLAIGGGLRGTGRLTSPAIASRPTRLPGWRCSAPPHGTARRLCRVPDQRARTQPALGAAAGPRRAALDGGQRFRLPAQLDRPPSPMPSSRPTA